MKVLIGLIGIILCCSYVKAEISFSGFPKPEEFSVPTVFMSSNTGAITVNTAVSVSTQIGFLHTVNVNTAGTSSSIEVFDGRSSTSTAGIRRIATIDTTSKVSLIYDILISSGIMINNTGSGAGNITITYIEWNVKR